MAYRRLMEQAAAAAEARTATATASAAPRASIATEALEDPFTAQTVSAAQRAATLTTAQEAAQTTQAAPARTAHSVPLADPASLSASEEEAAFQSWKNHTARRERANEWRLRQLLYKKLLQLPRGNMILSPFTQYKPFVEAACAFRALGDFYKKHSPEEAASKLAQAYNWCRMKARAPSIDEFLTMASEAAHEKNLKDASEAAALVDEETSTYELFDMGFLTEVHERIAAPLNKQIKILEARVRDRDEQIKTDRLVQSCLEIDLRNARGEHEQTKEELMEVKMENLKLKREYELLEIANKKLEKFIQELTK